MTTTIRGRCMQALALGTLVLGTPGCFNEFDYRTDFTSGFTRGAHRVSVLGVFKDGRMNFESWEVLAPAFSAAFGGKCGSGYDEQFVNEHSALAAAIDDVARADGLGEDLLTEIAPAASGDVVAVFTLAGRVEKAHVDVREPAPSGGSGGMGPGGSNANAGGAAGALGARIPMAHRGKNATDTNIATLSVSATLYSVSQKKTVGVVELEYTGENAQDAIAHFAAKIRDYMPGSTCNGWNWAVPIDEHRVRDLVER